MNRGESTRPEVTVVVPVYRNRDTLAELHRRLTAVLTPWARSFELVFVNDACPEDSQEILREMARRDARVTVLDLERNVGQQHAVLVGLRAARGRAVVVMDADLQDPPEAVPRLLARLHAGAEGEGPGAVFGGRRGWYESPLRLLTSRAFKLALRALCGVPADAGLFVAMKRDVIDRVLALESRHPHLVALIGCAQLPTVSIPVERARRTSGRSAYRAGDRLAIGLGAIAWVIGRRFRARRQIPRGQAP